MSPIDVHQQPETAVRDDGVGHGAVAVERLADLRPDEKNANAGTERGRAMVEESLRKHGAGRSILIDRNGRIIAGNHVVSAATSVGLDDCIVVPTDGRKLVAVMRLDLDADSPAGRALAVADNRTSEVGLRWEPGILAELAADETIDLSALFSPVELADLLHEAAPPPKFSPIEPVHRLDELKPDTTCPNCGHTWHRGAL